MTNAHVVPVVSVIMPVYNGVATLERAVRSVQGQTFAHWELLVVDDCSTDGSREAIAAWASADPRIRPIHSTENRGPGAARNLGLRSACGKFITYLDGDDEYDPQYLEHVARLRDKGDVLVFGYDFVCDDGRSPHPDPLPKGEGTLEAARLPERDGTTPSPCPLPKGEGTTGNPLPEGDGTPDTKGTVPDQPPVGARPRENRDSPPVRTWHPEANRHRFFETNIVTPLGIAHRREWIDKVGGFNELVSRDTDTDFVRRLARAGAEFAFFPLKSGRYHIRSASASRAPRLTPWQRHKVISNYEARKPIYGDRPAAMTPKPVRTIAYASPHCLIDSTSDAVESRRGLRVSPPSTLGSGPSARKSRQFAAGCSRVLQSPRAVEVAAMCRTIASCVALALGVLATAPTLDAAPPDAGRPNVLVLHVDQLRFDCLGAYGNPDVKTPDIDRFAKDGVRYTSSFCAFPVCTPSRYSLLSGRYVHEHAGWDNRSTLAPEIATFPRIFRTAGYRTKAVGKMHFTPTYLDVGFDELLLAEQDGPGRWDDDYHRYLMRLGLFDRNDLEDQLAEYRQRAPQQYWTHFGAMVSNLPEAQHSTTWIADRAVEALRSWKPGERHLLMVGFIKPHHPFDPPAPWHTMYDPQKLHDPARLDPRGLRARPQAQPRLFPQRRADRVELAPRDGLLLRDDFANRPSRGPVDDGA